MPTQEEREGPTPNGGVKSVVYYRGPDGSPAEKGQAVAAEIVEYGADGSVVGRTYGTFGSPPEGEAPDDAGD